MLTGPQWFRFRGRGLRRAGAGDRGGRRGAERKVVAGAGCGEAEIAGADVACGVALVGAVGGPPAHPAGSRRPGPAPSRVADLPGDGRRVRHRRGAGTRGGAAVEGETTARARLAGRVGVGPVHARDAGVTGPGSGSWQRHRPVALDDPPRGQHHETFWSSLRSTIVNTPARARQALLHETAGVAERALCLGKPLPVRSPAPVGRRSTRQPLTRPGAGTSLSLVDREWPSSGAHAVAVTYPPSRPPTCLERRRRTGGSSLPWPA